MSDAARAYRVLEGKRELGCVLGRTRDEALKRARECWPGAKTITVVPVNSGRG